MRRGLRWIRIPEGEETRLALAAAISLPALVASYTLRGGHAHGGAAWSIEALHDPAWIPILLCGLPILRVAFRKFFTEGNIRAGLLISIAILAAVAVGERFAAGEVAFIMTLGELLEGRTLRRAREGIHKLMSLAPRTACRLRDGREERVEAAALVAGDILRIRPGETVPVDGVILSGETSVDQAVITGESMPVDKGPGDRVLAGTVNRFGAMEVRAEKAAGDSTLQRMIRLVQEAQQRRAPVVRLADRWASILVPTALAMALAVWLVTDEVIRAVTVLVVFCPCALALATPTAVMATIANLSRNGILVKSGEALEAMGRMSVMAFDKTGTLTYGRPAVVETRSCLVGLSDADLLRIAAAAERRSEHPLGKAIAAADPDAPEPSTFAMTPGKGVAATVDGRPVVVGTLEWLAGQGIAPPPEAALQIAAAHETGLAVVAVGWDGRFAGSITLSDQVRPDARATIARLRAAGVRRTLLLTGDHVGAARRIAEEAGMDAVESGLLPEGKVAHVMRHAALGCGIAMVGDGVNDAPALKTATVGIAMGGMGSDIAIEAADIVLMRDDIRLLPYLLRMARRTLANIAVNISASLLINGIAIALAASGRLGPALGALVHNAGSVFVVTHAALLLRPKPDVREP